MSAPVARSAARTDWTPRRATRERVVGGNPWIEIPIASAGRNRKPRARGCAARVDLDAAPLDRQLVVSSDQGSARGRVRVDRERIVCAVARRQHGHVSERPTVGAYQPAENGVGRQLMPRREVLSGGRIVGDAGGPNVRSLRQRGSSAHERPGTGLDALAEDADRPEPG